MLRWVSVTPLGKPVVPDEYSSAAGSSGARSTGSNRVGRPDVQSARDSPEPPDAPAGASTTTRCSSAGQPFFGTKPASSAVVKIAFAPESCRRYSTSAVRKAELIDTGTAPRRWAA